MGRIEDTFAIPTKEEMQNDIVKPRIPDTQGRSYCLCCGIMVTEQYKFCPECGVKLKETERENPIYKICMDVLKVTDDDIEELKEIAREQREYFNPLKMATQKWQHDLAEHNEKVIEKLEELRETIRQGEGITKE